MRWGGGAKRGWACIGLELNCSIKYFTNKFSRARQPRDRPGGGP